MRVLSEEKIRIVAERNGWSRTLAKGYVDGQSLRRRGETPSRYVQVGFDEYSLGFRAGFYGRQLRDAHRDEPRLDSPLLLWSDAAAS